MAPAAAAHRAIPSGPDPAATPARPHPAGFARVLLWLFTSYQLARSGHPSPCRFTPTCSNYAIEAVSHHGARRGLALTVRRLGRCRPGGPSGYDPVPEEIAK